MLIVQVFWDIELIELVVLYVEDILNWQVTHWLHWRRDFTHTYISKKARKFIALLTT